MYSMNDTTRTADGGEAKKKKRRLNAAKDYIRIIPLLSQTHTVTPC